MSTLKDLILKSVTAKPLALSLIRTACCNTHAIGLPPTKQVIYLVKKNETNPRVTLNDFQSRGGGRAVHLE